MKKIKVDFFSAFIHSLKEIADNVEYGANLQTIWKKREFLDTIE